MQRSARWVLPCIYCHVRHQRSIMVVAVLDGWDAHSGKKIDWGLSVQSQLTSGEGGGTTAQQSQGWQRQTNNDSHTPTEDLVYHTERPLDGFKPRTFLLWGDDAMPLWQIFKVGLWSLVFYQVGFLLSVMVHPPPNPVVSNFPSSGHSNHQGYKESGKRQCST